MKRTALAAMALIVMWAISLSAQAKKTEAASSGATHKAGLAKKMTTTVTTPDKINWQAMKGLPDGAMVAALEGDPAKPGPYTMRLKFPDGMKIPPHWHSGPEHITVLSGEIAVGMGSTWDDSKLMSIPTGSFAVIAARDRHFGQAHGDVVLQLHGMGPWDIHYVNPADDPMNKK